MHMQYQIGGSDCGLFAIASACTLCNGQEPASFKYDQNVMRQHLLSGFQNKILTPFPAKLRRCVKSVRRMENIKVYCECRLPDNGEKMVQCFKCKEWFHTKCVRLSEMFLNSNQLWNCRNC